MSTSIDSVASSCHDRGVGGHLRGVSDRQPDAADEFRALYDAHMRDVLGYALRRTDDAHDAADVVAETFYVAWRRLDDVPDAHPRPWLLAVARRVLANQWRSTARRGRLADKLGMALDRYVVPPEEPLAHTRVRDALERLAPDDRDLLTLSVWEGLSAAELAIAFGATPTTIRQRLHRARQRLRVELDSVTAVDREEA
jgi:RNA polymerase sigma factor (sigma-70 family)